MLIMKRVVYKYGIIIINNNNNNNNIMSAFPVSWRMINFKDARSVSSYPYNQPQILQTVKYTE